MAARLRTAFFQQALRLSHATLDGRPSGEFLAVLTSDIPALEYHLTGSIAQMVSAPLTLVGGIVWLFVVNWQLSLLLLLSLPPTGWLVLQGGERRRAQAAVQQTAAAVTAVAQERNRRRADDQGLRGGGAGGGRFARVNDDALAAMARSNLMRPPCPPPSRASPRSASSPCWATRSWQVVTGALRFDVGAFLALVLLLERVSHGARQAGSISMSLGQVSATAEAAGVTRPPWPPCRNAPGAGERASGDWRSGIGDSAYVP